MNIYKKPEKYVCRGIEFNSLEQAEFFEAGRLVQDYFDANPDIVSMSSADTLGQLAVNVIFDNCQVTLRRVL